MIFTSGIYIKGYEIAVMEGLHSIIEFMDENRYDDRSIDRWIDTKNMYIPTSNWAGRPLCFNNTWLPSNSQTYNKQQSNHGYTGLEYPT